MNFEITDDELAALIAEAEREVEAHLAAVKAEAAKQGEPLKKNAPPTPPEEDVPPPAPEADAAPAESEPASAIEEESAVEEEAGAPTMEELVMAYSELPPDMLKMHYIAAKKALFDQMAATEGGAEASPPAPPEGPAPEASAGPGMGSQEALPPEETLKSAKDPNGGKIIPGKVQKSEAKTKIESLAKSETDKRIEELQKSVEGLTKALELALSVPVRKAVTGVAHIAKSEEVAPVKTLSKAEITERLKIKTMDPTLSKADRELVNSYYAGNITVEKIEHLLN